MYRADLFPQLIARRAAETPDRVLLDFVTGEHLTYGELDEAGNRWAAAYAALGVSEGDTVVVMSNVRPDYYGSWLGLTRLRAIDASINSEYRGDLLTHVLDNSHASVIVTTVACLDRIAEVLPDIEHIETVVVLDGDGALAGRRVLSKDEFLAAGKHSLELDPPEVWDTAAVFYTSGTTGPSKGVVMPWGHLYRQSRNFVPIDDLTADDVLYLPIVTYHIGGKVIPYLAAQINGRAVLRDRFSPNEFWSDIRRHDATTTAVVGAMVPWITASATPEDERTPLRNVVMAPPPANVDDFKRRFGVRVATAYSMTEISNPIASDGWNVADENASSCGVLKAGFEARIVDEHDADLPDGVVGELIVRSDEPWTLNQGYLGMPDASFQSWRNGWFHTGDGFMRDGEGRYYFRDRLKDTIRRRGENISSFEVEGVLNQHPEVVESAAVAVPSEHTEDEVMAFVRRMEGSSLSPAELIEWVGPRMARFMVPRYVEFVDELPKTPTDRVQKKILRERGVGTTTWDREQSGIALPR